MNGSAAPGGKLEASAADHVHPGDTSKIDAAALGQPGGPAMLDSQGNFAGTAFAFGGDNSASADFSHAEGDFTQANGYGSHAEGEWTQANGDGSHAEGESAQAGGYGAHAEGLVTNAGGDGAHAEGTETQAEGYASHAEGDSTRALGNGSHAEGSASMAGKSCQRAHASGLFAVVGDAQHTELVLRRTTTTATPAELTIDGAPPGGTTESVSNRFICAAGKTYACVVQLAARAADGTSAFFFRQVLIKNVGGTVSLVGSAQTVGVNINPAGWTGPSFAADNTNKSLQVLVAGAATTSIRWCATIHAQEIGY